MLEAQGALHAGLAAALRCLLLSAGTISALVAYGWLQERMMAYPYGDELFSVSIFLVLCNRIVAAAFAVVMMGFRGESWSIDAPVVHYAVAALVGVPASACRYEALKWVIFPVQILAKSVQFVPPMLLGLLNPLGSSPARRYRARHWLVAVAVISGSAAFCLSGPITADRAGGKALPGLVLLAVFVALNGYGEALEENLFAQKKRKYNHMLYTNVFGAVACVPLLALHSTLRDSTLGFAERHASFSNEVLVLTLVSLVSQLCSSGLLHDFGPALFSLAICARQVTSVAVSYEFRGHTKTALQEVALALTFTPLLMGAYMALFDPRGARMTTKRQLSEKSPLYPDSEDSGQKA